MRVPGDADADLVVGRAEPVELGRLELGCAVAEQRIEAGAAIEGAEDEPVLGCRVVEEVGQPHAAAALHVLRHHGRIAGNVFAEMARQHARIGVVAPADAGADVNCDGLAAVEVGGSLAMRVPNRAQRERGDCSTGRTYPTHVTLHSSIVYSVISHAEAVVMLQCQRARLAVSLRPCPLPPGPLPPGPLPPGPLRPCPPFRAVLACTCSSAIAEV